MKQSNSHKKAQVFLSRAVHLTALVLALGLLIGLLTGCPTGVNPGPNNPTIFKTDGKGIITGYTCTQAELPKDLVIPAKIGNEVITGIGKKAFYECMGLTSVSFPQSLTLIDKQAFQYCKGLTSLDLPKELTSIGNYAFFGCEKLTSVNLPAKLESIGDGVFSSCTNLTSLTVAAANENYTSNDNIVYTKDMKKLVAAAGASNLTSLIIPEGVIFIGDSAFGNFKNLTQVIFPQSLTSIGSFAFTDCTGLTSVIMPLKLETIEKFAFAGCTNAEIKLPTSINTIGYAAFGKNYNDDDNTSCKKILIKKGSEFERIKALVTGDPCNYPEDRIGEYE